LIAPRGEDVTRSAISLDLAAVLQRSKMRRRGVRLVQRLNVPHARPISAFHLAQIVLLSSKS